MHKLLSRQLKRFLDGDAARVTPRFLEAIDLAYRQADEDRALLERSMELTSQELLERYDQLRGEVTKRARLAESQQLSMSLLKATLESTADGILVVDAGGGVANFNRRFCQLWRVPKTALDSADGEKIFRLLLEQLENPGSFREALQDLEGDPLAEGGDVLHLKDQRVFELYSKPQLLDGKSVGRVWSFRDITQRERLEEQIRQSQKMEAVGRLAGGIAHDFNNLLTVITGYCALCRGAAEADGNDAIVSQSIAEIDKAAHRAAALVAQLLAFSRQEVLESRIVDLNEIVGDLREMLRPLIGEDIEVRFDLAADPSTVEADPGRLQQIVLNLVLNARDAMPGGGVIRLATESRSLETPEELACFQDLPPGPYVLLRVRDDGQGIPEELRTRIFEPFFTTKEKDKGTGLGLSTIYGIVQQAAGGIAIDSELGEGTEFQIALPRAEGIPAEEPPTDPARIDRSSEATILIVEDEDLVREVLIRLLGREGYRVLSAASADEALEAYSHPEAGIDLLVTDIVMPGMNGYELARRFRESRPQLRTLFISGYDPEEQIQQEARPPRSVFLPKPFEADTFRKTVLQALGLVGSRSSH